MARTKSVQEVQDVTGQQRPPALQAEAACIRLLRGKTDTEKFAGLLLAAKHLDLSFEAQSSSPRPHTLHWRLYEAAGAKFFSRLLRTAAMSEAALAVIARLCSDPRVASEFTASSARLLALLGGAVVALSAAVPAATAAAAEKTDGGDTTTTSEGASRARALAAQTKHVIDAVDCVAKVACSPAGVQRLLRDGAVRVVLRALEQLRSTASKAAAHTPPTTTTTAAAPVSPASRAAEAARQLALLLLSLLRRSHGSSASHGHHHLPHPLPPSANADFVRAARLFRAYVPPVQWTLLSALPLLLQRGPQDESAGLTGGAEAAATKAAEECGGGGERGEMGWEAAVREGLMAVWVVSQMPPALREASFQLPLMLCAATAASQGPSLAWAFESMGDDGTPPPSMGRFVTVWSSLAAIELKLVLDDFFPSDPSASGASDGSPLMDDTIGAQRRSKAAATAAAAANGNDVAAAAAAAAAHDVGIGSIVLRSLEIVIGALCAESEAESDAFAIVETLSADVLLRVLRTVRQSAALLLAFLAEATPALAKLAAPRRAEQLLVHAVRVVGRYLLDDDNDDLHRQFRELLPALCQWWPTTHAASATATNDGTGASDDAAQGMEDVSMWPCLLPILDRIAADPDSAPWNNAPSWPPEAAAALFDGLVGWVARQPAAAGLVPIAYAPVAAAARVALAVAEATPSNSADRGRMAMRLRAASPALRRILRRCTVTSENMDSRCPSASHAESAVEDLTALLQSCSLGR